MEYELYERITKAISKERLFVYTASTYEETINNYLNNIEVCRAFYPLLNFFEVCLRNAIDKTLTEYLKNQDWLESLLIDENSINKIKEAKKTIKMRGYEVTHGRIVAELNLGFWISFVSKKFSQYQYQSFILMKAFPHCPKYMRIPKIIQKRFENFRILRNRISHCERINHYNNLLDLHDEILESIKWIDIDIYNLVLKIDNVKNALNFKINL